MRFVQARTYLYMLEIEGGDLGSVNNVDGTMSV